MRLGFLEGKVPSACGAWPTHHFGGENEHSKHQTQHIHHRVALAALDPLAASKPLGPPCGEVLND